MASTETESERRRALLAGLLLLLIGTTQAELHRQADALAAQKLPLLPVEAILGLLADAHAHAGYLGRTLAGSNNAFGLDDVLFGQFQAQGQAPFLRRFAQDLLDGRYTDAEGTLRLEAVKARLTLYARRLRGTANEAWTLTLPPETVLYWRLGRTEDHCEGPESCPEMEAANPHMAGALTKWPGDGQTPCHVNCLCHLETADGQAGFRPEEDAA